MYAKILQNVRKKNPLVQAITNYVTVNDCANTILACGGSPIMADNPEEAADVAAISSAVSINIGTPNPKSVEGMLIAGKAANRRGIPVVLDPVGAGVSPFRDAIIARLLQEIHFSVIRGNISEIKFLAGLGGKAKGVDASSADEAHAGNMDTVICFAQVLSEKTGAVIVITGATDIVADGNRAYIIQNGHPLMSKVTGTGCMLTALIAAYCAANSESVLEASACAVMLMGLSGELAYDKMSRLDCGTGSYRTFLIDYLSTIDAETLERGAKVAVR